MPRRYECQGILLKIHILSKYAFSLVSNARDKMSRYVMRVSKDLEEECHASMLYDNLDLSRFIVNAQQVDDSRLRKKNMEGKKVRSFESSNSKNRLDVKANTKFKRGFKIRLLQISSRI